MKLNEAKALVEANQHLIGRFYKNDEITDIVIIPKSDGFFTPIVMRVINDEDYDDLLLGHAGYDVIALLDLDQFSFTGILQWEYLYDVLNPQR